jgi:hypothetical protein
MNKLTTLGLTILGGVTLVFAGPALAVTEYDQDVTPDVIFGSGNSNGGFTTDRQNGIEIGLRAKVPFVGGLNSNGDGTYSYSLAEADPKWNFDFTVNTDFSGTTGLKLDELTYELGMDADPSLNTDFLAFDAITPDVVASFFDHSIGDNFTANGGGTEAGNAVDYAALLANNNVLQQSWRYAFFPFPPLDGYDPSIPGTYAVYLLAKDASGAVVARTDIQVLIGGAPAVGPTLACEGFQPPLHAQVSVNKPNRVLPLQMNLFDGSGHSLTGSDIVANPVVQVSYVGAFESKASLDSLETAGRGDDGNMFNFGDTYWGFNMKTKGLASGEYTLSVVSGDLTEYVIDSGCEVSITIK